MKTSLKSLLTLALATCAGAGMVSCTADKDFYDPAQAEALKKAEYATNFVNRYGPVAPNQSWDFSEGASYTLSLGKETRATVTDGSVSINVNDGTTDEAYYKVSPELTQWMKENLREGQDNRSKGHAFYMKVPSSREITIVPIYQGNASMTWDFFIAVGDGATPQKINFWSKNDNLQIYDGSRQDGKEVNFPTWTNLGQNSTKGKHAAHTMNGEYEIRGKEYVITFGQDIPENTPIYFFLKIRNGDPNYAVKGKEQSSLIGQMLALECPENVISSLNLPEGRKALIMGCEDANLAGGDWDINDVVFLLHSDPLPVVEEVENYEVTETSGKRYMVEDLGATDDFDFNDIVFDVVRTAKMIYKDNTKQELVNEQVEQKVIIRAAGGTLDLTINIGGFGWNKKQALGEKNMAEMINTSGTIDWNKELAYSNQNVPSWKAEENNVSVTVYKAEEKVKGNVVADRAESTTITFPKEGEIPMIIAVPLDQHWMTERQSVPQSWFTIPDTEAN